MRIALITFDGFGELDTFVTLDLLNRLAHLGWKAELTSPVAEVTSANGVTVRAQQPLAFANDADAVVFGSGIYARAIAEHSAIIDRLQLDPLRQLVAAQGAGTLLMARLGLLGDAPACTDASTRPWLIEAGVLVIDEPFHARGPIATAGGPMASPYLAAWLMSLRAGEAAAGQALREAAPVGEQPAFAERVMAVVAPFLPDAA